LSKSLEELYVDGSETRDPGLLAFTWYYDMEEPEPGSRILDVPDVLVVLKKINVYYVHPPSEKQRGASEQRTYTLRDAPHVPGFAVLRSDGSTACGSWIYSGV